MRFARKNPCKNRICKNITANLAKNVFVASCKPNAAPPILNVLRLFVIKTPYPLYALISSPLSAPNASQSANCPLQKA